MDDFKECSQCHETYHVTGTAEQYGHPAGCLMSAEERIATLEAENARLRKALEGSYYEAWQKERDDNARLREVLEKSEAHLKECHRTWGECEGDFDCPPDDYQEQPAE